TYPDDSTTHYRYDENGQCTAIKAPDGQVQQFAYSPLGLLSQQVDGSGKKTQYLYNGLSQVVKRIDPLGNTLDYHYDGERNLVGLTNEKGENYHLRYDLNERLIEEVGFDGRVQKYHYNAAGHLVGSDDFSANGDNLLGRLHYQRDNAGRLIKQFAGGIQAANEQTPSKMLLNSFDYDPLGRITGAQNENRHLQWRYDAVGRVIEDHQDQQVLKHSYNANGQRTASQLPNGETTHYQYDNNGAFTGLNYGESQVASITRDSLGREIKRALSNNLTTEHNYDPQGRLQRQTTYKAGSDANRPAISQRHYSYTQQGLLSQIDDMHRGSTQYHYDALDRLTQVNGPNPESFVHDPAGNILAISSDASAQAPTQANQIQGNRLQFQGDTHYRYDDKGNRIGQARGKGQKLKTAYRYNS
ncbi:MAG: RHS repeat protein, partial [Alteromonas sp.]|nr:RHS repeat protein [Alteromonas sp.]